MNNVLLFIAPYTYKEVLTLDFFINHVEDKNFYLTIQDLNPCVKMFKKKSLFSDNLSKNESAVVIPSSLLPKGFVLMMD